VGTALITLSATLGTARADDFAVHQITYTVTSERPLTADIYYRDVDPPTWADYSHNPYEFSPKATAQLEPGRPWTLDDTLADPDQWAMVAVSAGAKPSPGVVRCALAVDGIVVDTSEGSAGAVCSLRHW
jgi:hypothetical protein